MTLPQNAGKNWSRDELILALFLYCQIPFNRAHSRDPEIVKWSGIVGRTPSSLSFKLGNFGSLDATLAAKGIKGLVNIGKMDRQVWDEFHGDWAMLVSEAARILEERDVEPTPELASSPPGPSETEQLTRVRRHQQFFRSAILSSYQEKCCICSFDLPALLVASHIVPWAENEKTRVDPQNGLCLCSIHDKAFDSGLMAVDPDHIIHMSSAVQDSTCPAVKRFLADFDRSRIIAPSRFPPNPSFLEWHLEHRFAP